MSDDALALHRTWARRWKKAAHQLRRRLREVETGQTEEAAQAIEDAFEALEEVAQQFGTSLPTPDRD